jgi:hypothetical protein
VRASFAFPPSDFSFAVDGSGVSWYGRCSADFMDTSPESYPSRGGVTFLNHFQCELSILAREEGALDRTLHAVGLDERIAQIARATTSPTCC